LCGLVGVIGDLNLDDKKAFDLLLKLDTTRGKHSTGVARIPWNADKRGEVEIVKDVGTPWNLIDQKPRQYYNDHSTMPGPHIQGSYIALMGHNRWATVGEVNEANAHPFEAGKIIGAQNGTLPLSSIYKLDDHEFYETDTEALMFNIDLHGVENVIPKISGAWALTWYNREEDSFNILRNKERPLHFAWKENKKVMYYASDAWMLYAISDKFNINFYEDDRGGQVWQFLSDTHYKFAFPKNGATFNKDNAWEKKELKGYEAPATTYRVISSGQHTARDSMNVFMGNSAASPMSSVEYWVGKRNKTVEFTVDGTWAKDEQNKSYIIGTTVNGGAELRIYPSNKHPSLEFILGSPDVATFAAKIKKIKVVGNKRFYMTIDYDTLIEATYNGCNYKATFKDIDDDIPWERFMAEDTPNEAEFKKQVEGGCAWCSAVPFIHEAPNILWIGNSGDFICADCSENPEVTQYVTQFA
jgi:predicted glutamine amidotransferase